jgi:hypothetical protein
MFAACAGLAYYLGTALRLEVSPRSYCGVAGARERALAWLESRGTTTPSCYGWLSSIPAARSCSHAHGERD